MSLKFEWISDNEKGEKWIPFGTKYRGSRYIVWDWYLLDCKIKTIFRAYICKSEAMSFYSELLVKASKFGGLARRLGVRRMTYRKVLDRSKIVNFRTGKLIKMPKKEGCSPISWERANQLVFEI